MAKVALICRTFDEPVKTLARSLHEQGQEVVVLTSQDETTPEDFSGVFLISFKSWSAIEGAKMIPSLMQYRFETLHFVFANELDNITPAHWILWAWLSRQPQISVVASSFEAGHFKNWGDLFFLRQMHSLTFSTRADLMRIKRSLKPKPQQILEVIPPLRSHSLTTQELNDPDLQHFISRLGFYIVMPTLPSMDLVEKMRRRGFSILSMTKSKRKNRKHFEMPDTSESTLCASIAGCKALFLADSDLSMVEMQRLNALAQYYKRAMIVDHDQTEALPGLCQHKKNGWIIGPQHCATVDDLLNENQHLSLAWTAPSSSAVSDVDASANLLIRLYQRPSAWL
jgi:hypothetical protein